MTSISATDPRTATPLPPVATATGLEEVADIVRSAEQAFSEFSALDRETRATVLDSIADRIEAHRDELIAVAMSETGFAEPKLSGELVRTAFQFRFFAELLREGGYLEATIDHAGDTPMGPRPDLRRLLVPLGPVAVFGSSNFPFAFSVLGGDTVSALAAGNPVVVKAHSSHPGTSLKSYEVLQEALSGSPAPLETIGIVFGQQAGRELVTQPAIRAVGFTGSLHAGKALMDAIATRDEPIPFYGELSSVNPVFVTAQAAAERADAIGAGFAASVTVGAGQLCTKPGFLLVPEGEDGDRLVSAVASDPAMSTAQLLLNRNIHGSYRSATEAFDAAEGMKCATAANASGAGFTVAPRLYEISLDDLREEHVQEVFGPVAIVVRYPADRLLESAERIFDLLPHSLTATIHMTDVEAEVDRLVALALPNAGRIVFNAFPTGVAVAWAQTHGGPWPSTNTIHTSVGATSIRRFLRPVTYQDAPAAILPEELAEEYTSIPRRIDGVLIARS